MFLPTHCNRVLKIVSLVKVLFLNRDSTLEMATTAHAWRKQKMKRNSGLFNSYERNKPPIPKETQYAIADKGSHKF